MKPRHEGGLFAAICRWLYGFVRRMGPNQGHAPKENTLPRAENPREQWLRQYKTSRPPEDWLRRVAKASGQVSGQTGRPPQRIVTRQVARAQVPEPKAQDTKLDRISLQKKPQENDAAPLKRKNNLSEVNSPGLPSRGKPESIERDGSAYVRRPDVRSSPEKSSSGQQRPQLSSPGEPVIGPAKNGFITPPVQEPEQDAAPKHYCAEQNKMSTLPPRYESRRPVDVLSTSPALRVEGSTSSRQQLFSEQPNLKAHNSPTAPRCKHGSLPIISSLQKTFTEPQLAPLRGNFHSDVEGSHTTHDVSRSTADGITRHSVTNAIPPLSAIDDLPPSPVFANYDFNILLEQWPLKTQSERGQTPEIEDPWPELPKITAEEAYVPARALMDREHYERVVREQRGGW
jgi:hypothetical protein